jgi:flagellar M-ring protein FliF
MANILEQAKAFTQKLSVTQKVIIVTAIIAVLTILVVVLMNSVKSTADYSVLYSDLNPEDAAKIVENLKENKVEYELKDGGGTILVPKEKVYEMRVELAGQGLPASSTVGYEIFDKSNLGMSEYVQKLNYKRALEGELARTINSLEEVKSTRVHIVLPEKALFKEDQKQPTASVTLQLKPNKTMSQATVAGIQNLVAKSVEGMQPDAVTVVDHKGRIISTEPIDKSSIAGMTAAQHQQQIEVEQYLSQKVQSMLDNVLGAENASVKVTADLNFTQIEKTITDYDPEKQVVRSEQNITEKSQSTDSLSYPAVNMAKDQSNVISNYEISQSIEKIVNEVGNIKRLTTSVLINGTTKIVDKNGKKVIEYTPRTKEELQQLELAVKNAVGYDPNRNDQISVLNVPFDNSYYEDIIKDSQPVEWYNVPENRKLILLVAIIILTLIFMFRLLQSKYIKDRIRIALSLPENVAIAKEEVEEEEEPEEDLSDFQTNEDELLLLPGELPEQLMLESTPSEEEHGISFAPEAELDEKSLAAKARAELDKADSQDLTEERLIKMEMKKKIQEFVDDKPDDAVKLVRIVLSQDLMNLMKSGNP